MSASLALGGKTILLTRARAQSEESVAVLSAHGAKCLVFPVISIHPPENAKAFQDAVASLPKYDWILFTSVNGVRATLDEIDRQKLSKPFGDAKIAVVGTSTARALEERNAKPDLIAKQFVAEALAKEVLTVLAPKSRVLLLRAKVGREVLPEALVAAGHALEIVVAYETKPAAPEDVKTIGDALGRGEIDFVTFTSASTVTEFCALFGTDAPRLLGKTRVVSIGPVTTEAAEKLGIVVAKTASPHTAAALVDALLELSASRK